jgi:hypothetical protein
LRRFVWRSFAVWAAALIFASFLQAAPRPAIDPSRVVASIYQEMLRTGRPADRRGAPLSTSLAALWTKADNLAHRRGDETGPLDFDPTTNSQGMTLKSFKLSTELRNATHATVVVTVAPDNWARQSERENDIRYDLIFEGARWSIDDIHSVAGPNDWSLRDLLSRSLR